MMNFVPMNSLLGKNIAFLKQRKKKVVNALGGVGQRFRYFDIAQRHLSIIAGV